MIDSRVLAPGHMMRQRRELPQMCGRSASKFPMIIPGVAAPQVLSIVLPAILRSMVASCSLTIMTRGPVTRILPAGASHCSLLLPSKIRPLFSGSSRNYLTLACHLFCVSHPTQTSLASAKNSHHCRMRRRACLSVFVPEILIDLVNSDLWAHLCPDGNRESSSFYCLDGFSVCSTQYH